MRIVTFTGNVYETDKIEFGGWDESHEKYSHDRVVFFDLEAEEWVNMECAVIVCIVPDAPVQEDVDDEPEEDPEPGEQLIRPDVCDGEICVGDCDKCDFAPSTFPVDPIDKAMWEISQEPPVEEIQAVKPQKKSGGVPKSKIDHGRIVALYTARPPRSVSWIADDLGCAVQTVINHLKAEGIYRGKK